MHKSKKTQPNVENGRMKDQKKQRCAVKSENVCGKKEKANPIYTRRDSDIVQLGQIDNVVNEEAVAIIGDCFFVYNIIDCNLKSLVA